MFWNIMNYGYPIYILFFFTDSSHRVTDTFLLLPNTLLLHFSSLSQTAIAIPIKYVVFRRIFARRKSVLHCCKHYLKQYNIA